MGSVPSSLAAMREAQDFPLKHSAILDPGSTISVTNQEYRLTNLRPASPGDFLWSGDRPQPILAYGTATIPFGNRTLTVPNTAYCPSLLTTLVSLRDLRKQGIWWDNRSEPTVLRHCRNNNSLGSLKDLHGQYVMDWISNEEAYTRVSSFNTERRKTTKKHNYNSWTKRPPLTGDAWRWHQRLGHPGPGALEHLVHASQGVVIRGPSGVECEACGLSKARQSIRRAPRPNYQEPGERLAVDFHDYEQALSGETSHMILTCRTSGVSWDYALSDRKTHTILAVFKAHIQWLKRQYGIEVKVVECDNEIKINKPQIEAWLVNQGISVDPSAPNTQSQNGGAERSGGVIKTKARAMRVGSRLPAHLWPEIVKAAVYLYNRTPRYSLGWKTPYDTFFEAVSRRQGVVLAPDKRPDQTHLRAFGCRVYVVTTDMKLHRNRLDRLQPKCWIGFLVGYRSSNIYRVWIPHLQRVISTRDARFHEEEFYDGTLSAFEDQLAVASVEDIQALVDNCALTESESQDISQEFFEAEPESQEEEIQDVIYVQTDSPEEVTITQQDEAEVDDRNSSLETSEKFHLITPPPTPPSALLAYSIANTSSKNPMNDSEFGWGKPWKSAFLAGIKAAPVKSHQGRILDRASVERALRKGIKIPRKLMPPPPRRHSELENHPFGNLFQAAEKEHLKGHDELKTWTEIRKSAPQVQGQQVLDCMWVYVYKFDKHGRFLKAKARLVVRGDQQRGLHSEETYAATLAGKSFRTLIAVAAKFDLEMIQYDVVNAFCNAPINRDVFMRMPLGYRKPGRLLLLNRALYGLRISPLLWQRELTKYLKELGFKQVPHEPCCMIKGGIIFFFYVDDIIIAYRKQRQAEVDSTVKTFQEKYKLTGGEDVQWFLGMEILRDRAQERIWLSQSAYIEKISKLNCSGEQHQPRTPMGPEELFPRQGDHASPSEIQRYQRKIGSLLYAAVSTRPDIAFATSRLSRFLTNPSEAHDKAANRVLDYLYATRFHALQFGGGDTFVVSSDASFADNSLDRKSSQAYAMNLFGGLIGWRANKQDTVTTSTTEAELLALSQAAKEGLYMSRLIQEIGVDLQQPRLQIECDNQQTIKIVTAEIAQLKTKLRHVDIHNHWLRQEAERETIQVQYTPSAKTTADGLTKALPVGKWQEFLALLGMVDMQDKISERNRLRGLDKEDDLEDLQDQIFHDEEDN